MTIDTVRLGDVFDPSRVQFNVLIVGCGALGSAVALQLAKLNIHLTLVDGDLIESHNLSNQLLYEQRDIGQPKALTLANKLRQLTGNKFFAVNQRFTGPELSNKYVFACVDSMESRRLIYKSCILRSDACLIEGRIGVKDFSTYLWDRSSQTLGHEYESSLYSDEEVKVERAACGTTMSIGATANLAASMMVWQFMDFVMGRSYNSQVHMGLDSMFLHSRRIERQ